MYETHFGIHDHLKQSSPLGSIQFNESEECSKDFIYDNYLRTYLYKEINKKLHMTFDEFISRPRYEIENILRIVDEVDNKKMKINKNLLNDLEYSGKKGKIDE